MNLGIFLSLGDSLKNMEKSGQRSRFINYYLIPYSKNFSKVFVFSYQNERFDNLPKNVILVPNKFNLHRFLYGLLIPFINFKLIKQCSVFRAFHLFGTAPAILTKIFYEKDYIFNFAYDYFKFAKIDGKKKLVYPIKIELFFANLTASKIIVANSEISKFIPKKKNVFIPNGVDTTIFKPSNKTKNDEIKILSVGRLEIQKNFLNLIKALKGMGILLTLVGKGSLKEEIEYLAKEEKINLKIIDSIDNSHMVNLYNENDIFVLPSLIEGSPKVLLEAMSCGLPCLVSKVEGNEDIITDKVDGIFCDIDTKSIRQKIEVLIKDKNLRKSLGKQARKTVVKKYDLKKIVDQEIKILKELK